MADLIDRFEAQEAVDNAVLLTGDQWDAVCEAIEVIPTVVALELTAAELKYLINDTIAYIWKMEDSGRNKPEFGYDSRKALLEKLKQFKREHFPEIGCCCG